MGLKIRKSALLQYIALYIMLLCNSSNFYVYNVNVNIALQYAIIAGMIGLIILKRNLLQKNTLTFITVLLVFTIFVRMVYGGIGLSFWNEMAIKILCVNVAIMFDREGFLTRYVKVVVALAIVSLLFWGLQNAGINVAKILFNRFVTSNNQYTYDYSGYLTITNKPGYGQLLYSFLEFYPNRNIGIFSEPGVYQMVLNSAIFCLLFLPNYIRIDVSKRKACFVILSLCLMSTQSTSGYIGYLVIILGVLASRNNKSNHSDGVNWKKNVIRIFMAGLAVLIIDYFVRSTDSLIYMAVFSKLFTSTNQFSIVAENSTGKYRVASIMMAILAMVTHPLGMGVDNWNAFYITNQLAGAGGWPFKFGAILGVIPFICLIIWLFSPFYKIRKQRLAVALFVFLYFNTSLAQSSAVYPVLIMIPMFIRTLKPDEVLKITE